MPHQFQDLPKIYFCLHNALIPLVTIIAFLLLKIICLREQRVMMWSAFVVCLVAQVLMLKNVISNFNKHFGQDTSFFQCSAPTDLPDLPQEDESPGKIKLNVKTWLLFLPFIVLCIFLDLQFAYQVQTYKPKSFVSLPYKHIRSLGLLIAYASLISSIIAIVLSYLTFVELVLFPHWMLSMMLLKAFTWAPFIGWEFYDLIFEHLYMDTQY